MDVIQGYLSFFEIKGRVEKGFTLIELMIILAILGIVTTIGVPGFSQVINNNRMTTSVNKLVTAINLARSEAIKQGLQVTIRRKGTTSQQWKDGWDIFIDQDKDGVFDDNGDTSLCEATEDCLIKTYSGLPNGFTLTVGNTTYKDTIIFKATGMSKAIVGDTFRLCDRSQDTTISRSLIINAIGQTRVSIGTTACP